MLMNIWPSSLDCLFTELPTLLLIRRLLSNKKGYNTGATRVAIQAFLLWTSCIISIGDQL